MSNLELHTPDQQEHHSIFPYVSPHSEEVFSSLSDLTSEEKKRWARRAYVEEVPMEVHRFREVLLGNYNTSFASNPDKPVFTDVYNSRIKYSAESEVDSGILQPHLETIQRIEWSTMDQDFEAWDQAVKLLAASSELEDDEFNAQVCPELQSLLLERSPLFQHLASGDIDVTATHKRLGKTPFIHTFDVLMSMDTSDCIHPRQRTFRRIKALLHDIGKSIVANYDFMQNHAAFSQSLVMEFAIKKWKMSPVEAYQFTVIERWHHTAELLDMKVLQPADVLQEIYQNASIRLDGPSSSLESPEFYLATLCALNVADTESVKMYEYAAGAIVHTFELFKEVSEKIEGLPDAWVRLLSQMGVAGINWLMQLQITQAEIDEKIHDFLQALNDIITGIKGLSPEDVSSFIYSLFDSAAAVTSDQPA